MLLTHFLLAIDNLGLTVVVGIFSSIMTALGVIVAARFGLLGKREERLAARVSEVERREALCNDKLFKIRTIVTTLVMRDNIFLRLCPEAGKEVEETQRQMKEQLRELEILEEQEADSPHITKSA